MAMDDIFTQHFLAFIKPFNSELPDDHPDNFYLEREWRRYGNFWFQPDEVMRVLVKSGHIARLKRERPIHASKITAAPE